MGAFVTPAFTRAVVTALVALLLGIATRRVDVLVLGLPFAAYAVWAIIRTRPLTEPQVLASATRVALGEDVLVTLTTPDDTVCSVAVPRPDEAEFIGRAASAGIGRASVGIRPRRWGRMVVGPATWLVSDMIGARRITGRTRQIGLRALPPIEHLATRDAVARPVGITGLHTSHARGEGLALAEVRAFQPGDRLRRINWRVTSRTGTLHTNSTLTDKDTDVHIVIDSVLDAGHVPGTFEESSLDVAVRAATAIARHYLGLGDRVAVHDLGIAVGSLPLGSGPGQFDRLVELLARADRSRGGRSARRSPRVASGSLAFVLTPLLDDAAAEALLHYASLGAEVIAIDTLPTALGDVAGLRVPAWWRPTRPDAWPEAWAIRRLEREVVLGRVRSAGVPVVAWRGPDSLGHVLTAMAASRRAPRLRRG